MWLFHKSKKKKKNFTGCKYNKELKHSVHSCGRKYEVLESCNSCKNIEIKNSSSCVEGEGSSAILMK